MWAIFKREIQSFFTSSIGYMIIGLFLVLCGLFLWVFKGPFNILDYGFANLGNFFNLVPWVFLFLVPAVTMKSFSEEKKQGTLELLYIKPISFWQLVLGKFFGALALIIIALLPTLLYVYSVSQLGTTVGNLDMGVVMGSYFGLLFLAMAFVAIGLFCSTFSDNQIVAFITAAVLSFILFYGFDALAGLTSNGTLFSFVRHMGMKAHFEGVSRGVLDTRNLIYFIAMALFFLFATKTQLKWMER